MATLVGIPAKPTASSSLLDTSRALRFFGFQATHRLREGIPKTVAWFLAHRKEFEKFFQKCLLIILEDDV